MTKDEIPQCRTCEHWDSDPGNIFMPEYKEEGLCTHERIDHFIWPANGMKFLPVTHQDFGCIHHSELESTE